ncbi:type I restriction enzyme, S subunit [Enterococcus sp. AZ120]|uniref:restriction endonuclease subunit S n=1 Tax=Enterococcus TaxID=1350 RepID=UPI001C441165|nr:restriction endonuclease subunit S [Enterococcus faecalis]ELY8292836.1 restriction endonuclease subunit S [Enterococcus faecalis]QXN80695.1 restriction endonuclease subunit S [Enterococcus faecalis]
MKFEYVKLSEVAEVTKLAGFEFTKYIKYEEKGDICALRGLNIKKGYLDLSDVKYIDKETSNRLLRSKLFENDIVMTYTGSKYGNVAFIEENDKYHLAPNVAKISIKKEYDSYFYFMVLQGYEFQYNLKRFGVGSGQPTIPMKTIRTIPIPLPTLNIQKKIASFFKNINKKVEINNQIISTLEELAFALFKRWFVDFEFPDENGNPYKSSGGKMVDSELGEIPEGWEIIKLSDLVVQIKETFNPNKTEVEKVNHFSIPNFDSKKFPVIENVNTIKSNKTKITDFTVLFSKMNPNFERVWLTELNKSYLNVCSPEFIALDCKNINLQTYTYFLCKSTAFNRFLVNNATGSTGSRQRIKPSIAMGFKFVGAVDLINQYGEICSGISEQIMNLRNQIENLEEMRDALLPKLLSGEIELPEDEEM